jgi:hypothetical protein
MDNDNDVIDIDDNMINPEEDTFDPISPESYKHVDEDESEIILIED